MAVIHHNATLTPGKLELLAAWLPSQPWYRGRDGGPALDRAGGFRLDDPDGEVGIEFMVVTDGPGSPAYLVPLTYRAAALPGADHALITTAEHGVLGRRWVYDGTHDPVLIGQLIALIQGRAEPQAQRVSDTPDPTVTAGPPAAGVPLVRAGSATVSTTGEHTQVQVPVAAGGSVVLQISRLLHPGDGPGPGPGTGPGAGVSATWQPPGGPQLRGVFVTAQYHPPAS